MSNPNLTPLQNLDRLSRERWSATIAGIFILLGQELVMEMIGGGEYLFCRRMTKQFANQDLGLSDYQRIFHSLIAQARRHGWFDRDPESTPDFNPVVTESH